ncbi:MAG: glucosaminidase domain-containing protein [Alphaproteobacteria bacterium]|nr:glucosaminidase domain-containing protein [Alphaproteobacteria bacterium]
MAFTKKTKITFSIIGFLSLCVVLFYFINSKKGCSVNYVIDGIEIYAEKTDDLISFFKEKNYRVDPDNKDLVIPNIYVKSLPKDFNDEKFDNVRPALYTEILLPLIYKANRDIQKELKSVNVNLAKKYDVEDQNRTDDLIIMELKHKMGTIPTSLFLSMAAIDSDFGTSYYSRHYNNLFNTRTYDKDIEAAEPLKEEARKPGENYKIKIYKTLQDSVNDHLLYVNTNKWFNTFWHVRYNNRELGVPFNGYSASMYFLQAPNRTWKYPDELRYIMKQYNWRKLDLLSNQ